MRASSACAAGGVHDEQPEGLPVGGRRGQAEGLQQPGELLLLDRVAAVGAHAVAGRDRLQYVHRVLPRLSSLPSRRGGCGGPPRGPAPRGRSFSAGRPRGCLRGSLPAGQRRRCGGRRRKQGRPQVAQGARRVGRRRGRQRAGLEDVGQTIARPGDAAFAELILIVVLETLIALRGGDGVPDQPSASRCSELGLEVPEQPLQLLGVG